MNTSLHEYIDLIVNFFEDSENSNRITWTDVEGMGYGWAWLNYEEKNWHDMMCKLILEEINFLRNNLNNVHYIIHEHKNIKVFHFVYWNECRKDIVIRFSNNELYYLK